MKNAISLFMALVCCYTFSACTKDTIISGIITDKANGQPLEGVKVSFTAYKFFLRQDNLTQDKRIMETKSAVTGSDGRYSFQLDTKSPDEIEFEAQKDGYNEESRVVEWGKSESEDLAMNPVDATLRVKVINESGTFDNMYAVLNSGKELPSHYFQPWPFLLNQGETFTETFKVNGGQMVEIRWGNDENEPLHLYNGVHRDSIFCPRGGTTDFLLKI